METRLKQRPLGKVIAHPTLFCDVKAVSLTNLINSERVVSLALGLIASLATIDAAASTQFEAAENESTRLNQTKEGYRYMEQFSKAVVRYIGPAMHACSSKSPDTKEPAMIVFIVAADGHVTRVMASPNIPYGQCVMSNLPKNMVLPQPPHDGWPAVIGLANHEHEEKARKNAKPGPKDNPAVMRSRDSLVAYDKAIAPYVAKARATFPAAKKRFLAGLPAGYRFSVRIRLSDSENRLEDSFVGVESIKDDKITGILGAVDVVKRYKRGQRITVPESRIDDWVIVRPDGVEEGNPVGKFLDTYHPK
ncbi:MAG: hypothetical protein QOH39_2555 [Verrucomicrobiota bacterium]